MPCGIEAIPKACQVARLTDPDRLNAYTDALCNWQFTDYIRFELTEQSFRWIWSELDEISLDDIKRLMYEHVVIEGGEIDEQPERRPEWSQQYEYHHDLRLVIHDKPVYIETRLHARMPFVPDESWILVVNVHSP